MMIKAVIFDLAGVFIQSPKRSLEYARDYGDAATDFMVRWLESGIRVPAGTIDIYAFWQPHLEEWGIEMDRDFFLEFWFGVEGGNHEMILLARFIKERKLRLILHSNVHRDRALFYRTNFPFLTELFDRTYYAGDLDRPKPDPRAFKDILRENSLEPDRVVYVDDTRENVAAARSVGLRAIQYQGVDPLARELGALGIL